MERPTIIIGGKEHCMRHLTGRDWRLLGEFSDSAPSFADANFMEKNAAFVAQFYDGVTADDVLDMPLEDIFPASLAVRNYIGAQLGAKLKQIEKNSEEDKVQ